MDLYLVQWEDTTNIAAWQTPAEVAEFATNDVWHCTNVGYLVYEDDDCVVLAARRTSDDEHFGLSERIPRRAITTMANLSKGDRLEGWKAEALVVLDQWEECYTVLEAAGHGAPIGRSKALHVADYLRAHVS